MYNAAVEADRFGRRVFPRPEYASPAALARVRRGLLWLAAIVGTAVSGYMIAGWSFLDAVYMVVITVFGVGYGEVQPVDHPGLKAFTIGVVLAGCSAGLWVIGSVVEFMAEGTINHALGKKRMTRQIDGLTGHTIVCGFGRVGQMLCKELTEAGTAIVVIDADPTRIASAEALGYPVVAGDAAEEAVLSAANITAAAVLAVVLPDEAANVFITLSARELNGSIEIISRGERPETERKLLRAGANRVVLPTAAGASRIARMITNPSAESLLRDGAGMAQLDEQLRHIGLQFVEIPVPADSTLVNKMIDDIDPRDLAAVIIVAIRTASGEIRRNPHGTSLLAPDDTIILIGRRGDLPKSLHTAAKAGMTYRGCKT
jgi:voltage-gated potassium channel